MYGPTLALMGEYAGAKSNPEVIAPLNKLKSLIGDNGGGGGGIYELKVKGRDLVAVLANETRINRKGTNIKIYEACICTDIFTTKRKSASRCIY